MKIVGPRLTVDVIITVHDPHQIVLIQRKNPPYGWAIPGGFVDYGETVEHAAIREAKEETGLDIRLLRQFHVYSDPARDERFHSVSVVFIGTASGVPTAGDDAAEVRVFAREDLPYKIVFDHRQILNDYFAGKY